jgi:hypothetical protein
MKVTLTVEFDVEPEKELNAKEQGNVAGMLVRKARARLDALRGQRLGGEKQAVGWEVTVNNVEVAPLSKLK